MGRLVLPLMLFVLWEFPSMIMMSLHKLICSAAGRSLAVDFLGIWPYRLIGMVVFWPVAMLSLALAVSGGVVGAVGGVLVTTEIIGIAALLIWARVSSRGA